MIGLLVGRSLLGYNHFDILLLEGKKMEYSDFPGDKRLYKLGASGIMLCQ